MPRTKAPSKNGRAHAPDGMVCSAATEFKPRPSLWLWKPFIPLGGLTMIDGEPGKGKSTVLIDLAARVTRGDPMPDGSPGVKGSVLFMGTEDDTREDVIPRLMAAGAVLRSVGFPGRSPGSQAYRPPLLPGGLGKLETLIANWGAKVVVMDPYISLLEPGIKRNDEQEIRAALEPLNRLAQDLRIAVLLVRHPTKDTSQDPIYRGQGSFGITALARSALWLDKHATDQSRYVLAKIKGNKGKRSASRTYELQGVEVSGGKRLKIETVKVCWHGEGPQARAEVQRQEEDQVEQEERSEAEQFLRMALADDWVNATDLLRQAENAGIGIRTLKRTKARLKIQQRWNTEVNPRVSEWGAPPGGWHPSTAPLRDS